MTLKKFAPPKNYMNLRGEKKNRLKFIVSLFWFATSREQAIVSLEIKTSKQNWLIRKVEDAARFDIDQTQ